MEPDLTVPNNAVFQFLLNRQLWIELATVQFLRELLSDYQPEWSDSGIHLTNFCHLEISQLV